MAPHSMDKILQAPQWSPALCNFVTWCLMWDPRSRPTSAEAMRHEYFADAVDPLRPKSSTSRLLGRKHSSIESKAQREPSDNAVPATKPSWFRKSLIRDPPSNVPQQTIPSQTVSRRPSPVHAKTINVDAAPEVAATIKYRPFASKRASWTQGVTPSNGAPMPILPSIRPISPLSNNMTAQRHQNAARNASVIPPAETKVTKKIGRQLSVQSNGNHYADYHRQEAERALNGQRGAVSPTGEQKEGFFSHLRKRARRLSGKPQGPAPPGPDDIEANAGCSPWQSNRSSMIIDSNMDTIMEKSYHDVDKALQSASYGGQLLSPSPEVPSSHKYMHDSANPGQILDRHPSLSKTVERHPSLSKSVSTPSLDSPAMAGGIGLPISSRTRRALHRSTHPSHMYDTPDEEDELLHEALSSAQNAAKGLDRRSRAEEDSYLKSLSKAENNRRSQLPSGNDTGPLNPYPTPSPSAKRNGILFDQSIMAEPVTALNVAKPRPKEDVNPRWPTPPYDENEWAASAAASIFAAGSFHQ